MKSLLLQSGRHRYALGAMSNDSTLQLKFFSSLQGARAIAVAAVFLCHLNSVYETHYGFTSRVLASGWNGLYFFFVLSGFLISRTIFQSLQKPGDFKLKVYFARRILRTWPTYYLALPLYLMIEPWLMEGHYSYLTFTQNFFPFQIIDPTWSLAVEEQFYLLAPLLVAFIVRSRQVLVLLIVGCFGVRFYSGGSRLILVAFDSLLMGCGIGYFEFKGSSVLRDLSRRGWLLFICGLLLCSLPIYFQVALRWNPSFLYLFEGLGFSLTLISLLNEQFLVSKILSRPLVLFIGAISYPIYLIHFVVLEYMTRYHFDITTYTIFSIVVTIVVAFIYHRLIEKPFMRIRPR